MMKAWSLLIAQCLGTATLIGLCSYFFHWPIKPILVIGLGGALVTLILAFTFKFVKTKQAEPHPLLALGLIVVKFLLFGSLFLALYITGHQSVTLGICFMSAYLFYTLIFIRFLLSQKPKS